MNPNIGYTAISKMTQEDYVFTFTCSLLVDKEGKKSSVLSPVEAFSGRFKGLTGEISETIFELLDKLKPEQRVISVQDDTSGGYWEHLATKLNAKYTEGWYN